MTERSHLPPPAANTIALYGGSFDPVHLGHIATAEELLQRLPLQEIRLLPAARSPLKADSSRAVHRLAMLELAIEHKHKISIDSRELQRPPPSFTVNTLREVRAELGPNKPLVFIKGMDSFAELPRWENWQELTHYAHLLVVSRPGHYPRFTRVLEDWLLKRRIHDAKPLETRALADGQGGVLLMQTELHNIASRDIRAALARPDRNELDTSRRLNPAVRDYIERHNLYREGADLQKIRKKPK